MANIALIKVLLCSSAIALATKSTVTVEAVKEASWAKRVFAFQGSLPIKDDRGGDLNGTSEIESSTQIKPEDQRAAEEACWKLISEESVVTFALQSRVLDHLEADLKKLNISKDLSSSIEKNIISMRRNMKSALDALKHDKADEFFDSLFLSSEDVLNMSSILRDPELDDETFFVLIRTVSHLGHNNAALVSEFTEMCSFMHRSPKPRVSSVKSRRLNNKFLKFLK